MIVHLAKQIWFKIAVVLIIVGFGLFYLHLEGKMLNPPSQSEVDLAPGIINSIAIDMNDNGKISKEDIITGRDGIIAIKASNLPPPLKSKHHLFVFNNVESLLHYSKNHNPFVSGNNPIYWKLLFVTFNTHKKLAYYKPISQAGIAALIFNPTFIRLEKELNDQRYQMQAGTAIMSDSSTRLIKVVPIRRHYIFGIKLKDLEVKAKKNQ